ncbi:MAG: hypothetical protein PVG27_03525, partial [Chloroflexota bacterium]
RYEPGAVSNPRHYGKQARAPIDPRVLEAMLGWLAELQLSPAARPLVGASAPAEASETVSTMRRTWGRPDWR